MIDIGHGSYAVETLPENDHRRYTISPEPGARYSLAGKTATRSKPATDPKQSNQTRIYEPRPSSTLDLPGLER